MVNVIKTSVFTNCNLAKLVSYPQWEIEALSFWMMPFLKDRSWGTWVAQLVKRLTLDFSSGHDLMVHEVEPHIGLCANSTEPHRDLSPPSVTLQLTHTLSQNK